MSVYDQIDLHNRPAPDLNTLIDIHSHDDALAKHQRLIELMWGQTHLPDRMPDAVTADLSRSADSPDNRFDHLDNLRQIDRLTIDLPFGFQSHPYLFYPNDSNNRLIVYHQGHRGDFIHGIDTIAFFLKRGYTVMAFSLPLLGLNVPPAHLDIPRIGRVPAFRHHGHFLLLEPFVNGSTIQFFIEPIVVGLNYAHSLNFDDYTMIGLSGGGWATVMAAAIDPRIRISYPVAGSSPLYQRLDRPTDERDTEWGDYEQWLPGIFPELTYFELYTLGLLGQNRHQLAVYNKYDSCCFWGQRALHWADTLQGRLQTIDGTGTFEVFVDDSHEEHKVSEPVLNVVINHLAAHSS